MLNESIRKVINVDGNNISTMYTFKQSDDAVLLLSLYKNSTPLDITGQTPSLGIKRPDGTLINLEIEGDDNPFTISGNDIDIKLKNSMLSVPGKCECDLELADNNGIMTTASFYIVVNKKVVNDDNVLAGDNISTLNNIRREEALRKSAELDRVNNETERIQNENIRKTAEISRDTKEKERLDSEVVRKSNEVTRGNSETIRNQNETTRIANENARVSAETTRVTNENSRVSAENIRKSAEDTRKSAESIRVSAEDTRKSNETARVSAEDIRKNKEIERDQAETLRIQNETKRENAYKEIADAKIDFQGKTHDSIKEANDSNMGYINDRFNNASMLTSEDKYISVSESFDGVTKDLKVKGRTLKNLLGDIGNCEDLSKWVNGGVTLDSTLKLFGSSSFKAISQNKATYAKINVPCDQTHKYLLSAYVYISSFTSGFVTLSATDYNTNINATNVLFDTTKLNQWQRKSLIVTGKANGGMGVFAPCNQAPTATVNVDGIMLYDLTEIYGAGNEPTDITILEAELPYVDGITSIGEKNNKLEISSCNKNLFDYKQVTNSSNNAIATIIQNGINIKSASSGLSRYVQYYIKLKPNTKYTLSCITEVIKGEARINVYHAINGVRNITSGSSSTGPITFITTHTGEIMILFYCTSSTISSDGDVNFKNILLEDVDFTSEYQDPINDLISVPLSAPLRSLPNGICDIADIQNGKEIRKIGKKVLNGTESIIVASTQTSTNTLLFYTKINDAKPLLSIPERNKGIICNLFIPDAELWNITDNEGVMINQASDLFIRINKTKLATQDLAGFKLWLQNNPITVYYELTTPVEIPIVSRNTLRTYDGKSNIFLINNELDTLISAKLPVGTNEIFDARKSAVKNKTFGRVDDRLEEIEQELKDANTDFNGEQHDNINERIISDVGYINDRFNNASYLLSEDKYISVSESFDGTTKDLQVKGRTIKNLLGDAGNCEDLSKWNVAGTSNSIDSVTKLYGLKSIKVQPLATVTAGYIYKDITLDNTHKYLFSSYMNITSHTSGSMYLGVWDYGQFTNLTSSEYVTSTINQWQRKSMIISNKTGGRLYVGSGSATAIGYIDGVMLYDLTEIYGAGNEPTDIAKLEADLPFVDGIVSLGENNKIEICSCGKNLFDGVTKVAHIEGGTFIYKEGVANTLSAISKVNKPGTYTFSCKNGNRNYVAFFDKNPLHGSFPIVSSLTNTITVPRKGYIVLYMTNQSNIIEPTDIQLEESTIVTSYEETQNETIIVPLSSSIRSLPNGVCDIADIENGKEIRKIGKIVLDGSENWVLPNWSLTDVIGFALTIDSKINEQNILCLSPSFNSYGRLYHRSFNGEGISCSSSIAITISKSKLTTQDVTGFKAWLKANPTTVYYELATSIEIPINSKNRIRTYDGKTNIFLINNEIDSMISAKLPVGTNEIFDARKSEVKGKSFGRVDERFEEIEKEIKDATKDFDGNIHDNLSERIDADVGNIMDRFNKATLVEYDNQYVSANDSFNGLTKDLKLKGMTLINLYDIKNVANVENYKVTSYYFDKTLCNTSTLKTNTPYTLIFELDIKEDTSNGAYNGLTIGLGSTKNGFHKEIGISKTITPTIGKQKIIHSFNISDFLGYPYLAIRPIRRGTSPVEGEYVVVNVKDYILLEGDYTNKPIPSYFEGIRSVGEELNNLEVLSVGKNMFNEKTITLGYDLSVESGGFVGSVERFYSDIISVKPNTYYTTSRAIRINYYDDNKKFISGIVVGGLLNRVNKTPINCKYVRISNLITDIPITKLEEGTTATPYEPYKENKITIPLTEPLRSLPNGVTDEVDLENGKEIHRIKKDVLGNLTKVDSLVTNTNTYRIYVRDIYTNNKHVGLSGIGKNYLTLSNNLNLPYSYNTEDIPHFYLGESVLVVFMSKIEIDNIIGSTVEEKIKNYLTDSLIFSELITPIETPLDLPNNLRTYDGRTYIFTQGSLIEPNIYAKVPSDVISLTDLRNSTVKSKVFANADARVEELEQDVKNIVTQEAWITPTLLNGWLTSDGYTIGYYKDTLGIVRIKGKVKSGQVPSVIFSLPVGYRPKQNTYFAGIANDAFSFIYVASSGSVIVQTGGNFYVDLSTISFRAEQ